MAEHSPEIVRFVDEARRASGLPIAEYGAFAFGDTPELADELAALVLNGPKRATAGLLASYEAEGIPVTAEGSFWVVLDGREAPVCVIRTREVAVKPLGEVDEAFAWDEGEGDRSLAYWRRAHDDFFGRSGIAYSADSLVVLERFDLVYPVQR